MAASAPVLMAMLTSAWASAAASLTPSPATATRRPWACRSRTSASFSSGRRPAWTSSMPRARAAASALASLSPLAMMGRAPSERSVATARAAFALSGSAKASAPA